jgi:tetratricopeptide (TPR) repeat protein
MQAFSAASERPAPSLPIQQPPSWSEAVAAADWDRILQEAEAAGIPQTLTSASGRDLMALADAARYRRRMALARDALLALRERFPSSPRSLQAAYLLGRVEESSPSRISEALRWYDEYLLVAPQGAYASEALGRKMVLSGNLGRKAQTRELANEYLRRFPNGTYAGSARVLLESD